MTYGQSQRASIVQAIVEGHLQDADWQASSKWTNAYLKDIAVCSLKATQLLTFFLDRSLQCVFGSRVCCGSLAQRNVLVMLPPSLLLQRNVNSSHLHTDIGHHSMYSHKHTLMSRLWLMYNRVRLRSWLNSVEAKQKVLERGAKSTCRLVS